MKKFSFLLILISFLVSCQSSSSETEDNSDVEFFNLPTFFKNEIDNFSHSTIKKTVILNGEEETKELTDFDIEKELKLFTKIKLDKPSWRDKFSVAQSAKGETYIALDDKLSVREVHIDKQGQEVTKIKIITGSENTAFDSYKVMIYEPKKGHSIENIQDVALVGKSTQKIAIEYL